MIKTRIDLEQGQTLFKKGMPSDFLCIVRAGSLKTGYILPGKQSQAMGFHLPGDWVGMDSIDDGAHDLDAIALEPSKILLLPLRYLDAPPLFYPILQGKLRRRMSGSIIQIHKHLLSLGRLRSEERLASFLINISLRLSLRGHQHDNFHPPMSRADIASYLGVKQVTLSCLIAQFSTGMSGRFGLEQVTGLTGIRNVDTSP